MAHENSEIIILKNSIVKDMFIEPADQNYAVARWCYHKDLYLDFYWNACHALEKYFKASLLLNGKSSIHAIGEKKWYGHNIAMLFQSVKEYAADLFPTTLPCPKEIDMHWREITIDDFISRINDVGDANNRYNVFGYSQHWEDLFNLDRVVFASRRIAVSLDYYAFIGTHKKNGGPNLSTRELLQRFPSYMPNSTGSSITRLLEQSDNKDLLEAFYKWNFPFAPKGYTHGSYRIGTSSTIPVLYRRIIEASKHSASVSDMTIAELAGWVSDNIRLPEDAKKEILSAKKKLEQRSKPKK